MTPIDLARFGVFVAVLAATLAWQALWPARTPVGRVAKRWLVNVAMLLASAAVARLAAPLAAVSAAVWAKANGFGLSHALGLPDWAAFALTLIALDLAIYAQHRAMHRAPLLWRFHAVHHADAHVDATTALRFHPGEILLSMLWKAAVVVALGAPVLAVVVFEAAVNALALFNHANGKLPLALERALKPWLITPALHRLHHDASAGAAAPNYGFSVSLWDRLFGSFADRPEPEHLGLADLPGDPQSLTAMLAAPFTLRRDAGPGPSGPPARPGGGAGG
jgi:sterol desaturase/sphingolipid hydroxylase (fatty acid hydroxylase superfamily)